MKPLCIFTALMLMVAQTVSAASEPKDSIISMTPTQMGKVYKTASVSRVSVHDPSIVPVKNAETGATTYYVFGSHRACGRSTDLRNWYKQTWTYGIVQANGTVTQTTDVAGVFRTNQTTTVPMTVNGERTEVAFGNFNTEQWRYTAANSNLSGNQWAPDVIWNPHMQKWCMYMSLNGNDWRSSICLLTSDVVTGPYIYQGPVVFSGFQWTDLAGQTYKETDLELVLGTQSTLPARYAIGSSWGRRWPNNIDPTVFFDEDGEMWMAYGSWSGGIYMLRLNKENGLRDYDVTYPGTNNNSDGVTSDPYFGRKIAGGYYSSGEGAYIEHIGNYYYLFVTNGGLEAAGGYEMHYFRSKKPDGPYTDANGQSAIYSSYQMNYGPSAATTRGMKILGSYKWPNMKYCELSQGHNSLLEDTDRRAYLFYHTRFNNGTEGHEVRTHQLFVNQNGWLVASPFEFNGISGTNSQYTQGMIDTTTICTTNDIIGTYLIMMHPYKVDYKNLAYSTPQTAVFKQNGQISGDYYGTWKQKAGTSYITLHIRPKGTTVYTDYYGVALPQTVSLTNMTAISITAIAASGVSVWAVNVDGNYAIDYTYQQGIKWPVTARQIINDDVDLTGVVTPEWGTTVTWQSSHPDLLTDDGHLQVPYYRDGDSTTVVDISYTLQKDNYAYTAKRQVRVRTLKSLLRQPQDVNADGVVDTQDVLAVYEYILLSGASDVTADTPQDVNADGVVDTQDVLAIYELMMGE